MVPPTAVRRLLVLPAVVAVALAAVLTYPLTALLAALGSLVWPPPVSWGAPGPPGSWPPDRPRLRGVRAGTQLRRPQFRLLRVLTLAVGYGGLELYTLAALGWLWLRFGGAVRSPESERAHYALVRRLLGSMYRLALWVLHVRITIEGPGPDEYRGRPLIVCCRHAGPGDSFLIGHALLSWYRREPRIVLKDTLQWDPAIDIVLNRLPNRFIRSGAPGRATRSHPGRLRPVDAIAELATRLDPDDALVLFPEGGNFTDRRRARAIQRLRARGQLAEAEQAERLRHVLPPRPGGVVSALTAGPEADVVWVAHTGTDHLISVADIWRVLPTNTTLAMRWWRVPRDEIPDGETARVAWLNDWWRRIDDWIGAHRPPNG